MAGKVSPKLASTIIIVVVVFVVVMSVLADTSGDVSAAAGNLSGASNASGSCNTGDVCGADTYPLTSFFKNKGIILLTLMAGIAITMIMSVLTFGKKK